MCVILKKTRPQQLLRPLVTLLHGELWCWLLNIIRVYLDTIGLFLTPAQVFHYNVCNGGTAGNTARQPPRHTPTGLFRTSSNNSTGDENIIQSSVNSNVVAASTLAPRRLSISRNPSTNTSARRIPSHKNSAFSDCHDLPIPSSHATPPPAPPVLPSRQCDNADELSFRTGDLIQVIEEVDEGWCLGDVSSVSSADPPMPVRPALSQSSSTQQQYNNYIPEHPVEEEEDNASPFRDNNRSSNSTSPPAAANNSTRSFPYMRPNKVARTASASTAGNAMNSLGGSLVP
ncbi:hypothetical protein [Parasitella parasitica]|uniref:SH3 domain-containing protein n=1 Tax=Parasitella parasitica TaxID=35722 RepID=A0A0B7NGN4_9FUNG|nr:hypothetical protein [Parasitella parasitica]